MWFYFSVWNPGNASKLQRPGGKHHGEEYRAVEGGPFSATLLWLSVFFDVFPPFSKGYDDQ
jgi:hypothetical protein